MPRTAVLSPSARSALQSAIADDTTVRLTTQLDRKTYTEVNKVLAAIGGGGTWKRGKAVHEFPRDPRTELAALLDVGEVVIPKSAKQALGWFRTPDQVAQRAVTRLGYLPPRASVLEPSAGDGQLVRALRERHPSVWIDAVETEESRASQLAEAGASESYCCRFEEYASVTDPGFYDAALLNPPFSADGHPTLWAEHLELAWTLVRPGGRIVAIVPASLGYRTTKAIRELRDRITANGAWDALPDDAFLESGTHVSTLLVATTKPF
jgi:hypothetical protein